MDIREQLLAYLENRLSSEQRQRVISRLARSNQWQAEFQKLSTANRSLRQQMPVLGQGHHPQLQALLPNILSQTKQRPQWHEHLWKGVQASLFVGSSLTVLLFLPLLLRSNSFDTARAWSPNVPASTPTEAAQFNALQESTEEVPTPVQPIPQNALASPVALRWSASPAPMPGATLEPSREAPSKQR